MESIEEIVNQSNLANNEYLKVKEEKKVEIENVINRWLKTCNLPSLHITESYELCTFHIKCDNWKFDFSIAFNKTMNEDAEKGKLRSVALNCGTVGSFGVGDWEEIERYHCVGTLAVNLDQIENEANLIDWKVFDELNIKRNELHWKVQSMQRAIDEAEKEEKRSKFRPLIKVGTVINRGGYYIKPETKVIWMTNNNVKLDCDYGRRMKMKDVLDLLVKGDWTIADETKKEEKKNEND